MIHRYSLPLLLLLFTILACESTQKGNTEKVASIDKLDSEKAFGKQLPFDLFTFQRAYPDKTFDVRAYKAAMRDAQVMQSNRNAVSPPGFTAPWTTQGPGNAGARINIIEIDPNDDDVLYIGFSGGGVFKTTNDGNTWMPIFDDQPYLSIGAIEVDPNNSDIVYVGTGDPNITGYPFIGNGIYKSTNGGDSWQHMGLADMGIVSEIIVDPNNSNIVYAATMGNPFDFNNNRGLYKSTNGGQTWTQSLFISDQAGVIDMALHPTNSNILYAAGWDRIRTNQQSIVYGNNGRIFRSQDGGASWQMMTNGLPQKQLSRSSVSISPVNSDVVYVSIIDSSYLLYGIYATEDGGDSWEAITLGNSGNGLTNPVSNFGWYFGRIFAGPSSQDEAYLLGITTWKTTTQGDIWAQLPSSGGTPPHVDHHYLAFNSQGDMYLATDGGLYKRTLNGTVWTDIEDIAATQIYRIGYNPHEPDTYYGGAQDNGTQAGNAVAINDWDRIFGADGFQPVFHPTDPDVFYLETQHGHIWKISGGGNTQLFTSGIDNNDRIHWDMQYIMSAHDPERLYTGTHRMYRRTAGSSSWIPISGDLTDGNIYGGAYHTISTLHESPQNENILYVGTTDGNVWRSNDFGSSWVDISTGLPDRYVTCIKASPDDPNAVYVSHSGYKYNELIHHIHYSPDMGNTWIDISGNLPQIGINHIEVMPYYNGNVIFVATDAGVYATLDGGTTWDRLGTDFPIVTTYDLDLNIANNQLIAGTFGRSILTFPLDSIGLSFNPQTVAEVSGNIHTPYNANVNAVEVSISTNPVATTQTDITGNYDFQDINTGQSVTITPYKNNFHINGVSTSDIVGIRRHLLFYDTLDSYQLIAADVTENQLLSSYDLVWLSRLILEIDTVFPFTTSWRFVDAAHTFANPQNPFSFPESITYNALYVDQVNTDFVAIKMGDVNNTVDASQFQGDEGDEKGTISFRITNQQVQAGEEVTVQFRAADFQDVVGFQFTLKFDTDALEYVAAQSLHLQEEGEQLFGGTFVQKGYLTGLWSNALPITLDDEIPLFEVTFVAKQNGQLKDFLRFDDSHTKTIGYKNSGDAYPLSIHWNSPSNDVQPSPTSGIRLYQNQPNPLRKGGSTFVGFYLPEAMTARMEVYDALGNLLWSVEDDYPKGKHHIELDAHIFAQSGIYYYQLSSPKGQHITKRLLYFGER